MEKSHYQKIIDEVSKKLSGEILSKEKNLAKRALTIDRDIADIIKEIGLNTCKQVLDETRDDLVKKNAKTD